MTVSPPSPSFDWSQLRFELYPTNGYVSYTWTEETGWDEGKWVTDPFVKLHVATVAINYGQSCFEGLKAFRAEDGGVRIFRPQENAARLALSADLISCPEVPEEMFLKACHRLVEGNLEWVPPHAPNGLSGSFYLRPLLFGSGASLNLGPAKEYTFLIYGSPVGSLYGAAGLNAPAIDAFVVETFDRAAPLGTGMGKLAGNYAPTFKHTSAAKKAGYPITLHLDSATHKHIDEFSTSNFLGLIRNKNAGAGPEYTLVIPSSPSILKSVTAKSVVQLVSKAFGWKVEPRTVAFQEVKDGVFDEIAAAGTAAAISPIRSITYHDSPTTTKKVVVGDGEKAGPGFLRVLAAITAIQAGNSNKPEGFEDWVWPQDGFK